MFENVGNKIKQISTVVFAVGNSIGVIYFIVSIIAYFNNKKYIEYAGTGGLSGSSLLRESGDKALSGLHGIYFSISLISFSILFAFLAYGFGQLVDNSDNLLALTRENSRLLKNSNEKNNNNNDKNKEIKKPFKNGYRYQNQTSVNVK